MRCLMLIVKKQDKLWANHTNLAIIGLSSSGVGVWTRAGRLKTSIPFSRKEPSTVCILSGSCMTMRFFMTTCAFTCLRKNHTKSTEGDGWYRKNHIPRKKPGPTSLLTINKNYHCPYIRNFFIIRFKNIFSIKLTKKLTLLFHYYLFIHFHYYLTHLIQLFALRKMHVHILL